MRLSNPIKLTFLVIGDIAALYAALFIALLLRYGYEFQDQFLNSHLIPFTIIFPLWLLVFYIAGLYDLPRLRNNLEFLQTLLATLGVSALLTVVAFYLIPAFGITPKTNLFIFMVVFGLLEGLWRRNFNHRASFREGLNRILLLDKGPLAEEIRNLLWASPQMGFNIKAWLDPADRSANIPEIIFNYRINMVVVPAHLKHEPQTAKALYQLLASGIEVRDVPSFYEMITRKVPLSGINESWFVDHSIGERRFYDELKEGLEAFAAGALGIILLPLELLIAIFIKLTSAGPVFIRQTRIGLHGEPFTLYKFRSMRALAADGSAETNGAAWAVRDDRRITWIGKILRASHLDELPQLWNIIRGELSFVGPRPERPEFVTPLSQTVPFYDIRHIVKPGVTGWAQINYRYGASAQDAYEKLQYDIYYIKNRSVVLDLAIVIKTIRSFFINHE